jgi:hypothetical protein
MGLEWLEKEAARAGDPAGGLQRYPRAPPSRPHTRSTLLPLLASPSLILPFPSLLLAPSTTLAGGCQLFYGVHPTSSEEPSLLAPTLQRRPRVDDQDDNDDGTFDAESMFDDNDSIEVPHRCVPCLPSLPCSTLRL